VRACPLDAILDVEKSRFIYLRKRVYSHIVQRRGTQYHVICYLPKQPECGSQNESWRTLSFNLPSGVRLTTRLPKILMENGSRRRAVRHKYAS
jgi:hypothetical protein